MKVNEWVEIGQRVKVKWGKVWKTGVIHSVAGRSKNRNIFVQMDETGSIQREPYYSVFPIEYQDRDWTKADLAREMRRRNVDIDVNDINISQYGHFERVEDAVLAIEKYYYEG